MYRKKTQSPISFAIRWFARIGSLASAILLMMFLFGGNEKLPTMMESLGLVFFPFGILVGMAIGWKNELVGGVVTVLSLAAFYSGHLYVSGNLPSGPYFILFALPGILFLISGCITKIYAFKGSVQNDRQASTLTDNSKSAAR